MHNSLSIRSYNKQKQGHSHTFSQLVLPLRGVIHIEVSSFRGKVTPGECVIVRAGEEHIFSAEKEAKFVVADIDSLPQPLAVSDAVVFSVTPPLAYFLQFAEQQLAYQVNKDIEQMMFSTFLSLLKEQRLVKQPDQRIRAAIEHIEAHISEVLSITSLSETACLSSTQFKKLFKEQTGLTVSRYITKLRMEKAHALLTHTDYPAAIVAETVGYTDLSAFSRRFSLHFGLSPSKVSR